MDELPVAIHELGETEPVALHPELARVFPLIIRDFTRETGLRAQLVSSYRSIAQQRTLYAAYKRNGRDRAAPPGESAHNYGLAGDVLIIPSEKGVDKWAWATSGFRGRRAYRALHRVAKRYGLVSIVDTAPDDPFHLQVPGWRQYTRKIPRRA